MNSDVILLGEIEFREKIGAGAYADIFRLSSGRVLKLFRRMLVVEVPLANPVDNEVVVREVWDAEAAAHERLESEPALRVHLVPFFGRATVSEVRDDGNSRGAEYHLDCGLVFAFVPGRDAKIGSLMGTEHFSSVENYLDQLNKAGIGYTLDSSVFIPGLDSAFTVIDVATWDAMGELGQELAASGGIPERYRAKWRQLK